MSSKLKTKEERENRVIAVAWCSVFVWFGLSLAGCFAFDYDTTPWNLSFLFSILSGLMLLVFMVGIIGSTIEHWIKTGSWRFDD